MITIMASVDPNSRRARSAGGIRAKMKPMLGMKLNRNAVIPQRNAKSTPKISNRMVFSIPAPAPVAAVTIR